MVNSRCVDTSPGSVMWAERSDTDQKTSSLSQARDKEDLRYKLESGMQMM